MNSLRILLAIAGLGMAQTSIVFAEIPRPSLILTADGVDDIRRSKELYPLFDRALKKATARVERSIAEGVKMPAPKDPGGGFSHERHKENYKIIHDAGVLYQLTEDNRYLHHATDMLLAYADIYKGLPLHPARKKQSPGKLFWQSLNEAVWLVYTIQGFDAIAASLNAEDREKIELELLRPAAEFLSVESPETFRKIHNHGTWAAAAVGMTGYALRDKTLVDRAILGLDGDGESGFLAQLDQLFSPDGYYTEGPYYQRYALMPFVLFAQAIDHNDPDRKIFDHRDGVLLKAIDSTIQLSYAGKFFPINDAIREKGLDTPELVYGIAAMYDRTGRDDLLSIARYQGTTVLTGGGMAVAKAVAAGRTQAFDFRSMLLGDGPDGDQGALSILRMGEGELAQTLVVKNTSHGMGHGHFDKLSYILYDNGQEILTDYGAARFLNVPTKDGGRYLPENKSWAKQTIAHNTLVVNETSQFDGDWKKSQEHWPDILYFQASDDLNVVSTSIDDAYPSTTIKRTVIQLQHEAFAAPIMIDLLQAAGEKPAQYDLPFYFQGQVVDFNGALQPKNSVRKPLGKANGYQHLWVEANGRPGDDGLRVSWLNNQRFYTLHSTVREDTDVVFVRTGANDPNFNLRSQQGIILRPAKAKDVAIVSVIEPHGVYDPAAEFTAGSESQIRSVEYFADGDRELVVLETKTGRKIQIVISNNSDPDANHMIAYSGNELAWRGFITVIED